jgi:hypothetical protein
MTGLKHIIKRLWSKLKIGKRSTTERFKWAEQRCEEAERQLSEMDRSSEDIQHQMSDAVLRLEDGGTLPVNRETLSKYSEYFRFVWLLIRLTDM